MIRRPRRVVALPALAVLALSVAGCGQDEAPDGQPGRPSTGICEPNSAIVLGGSWGDDGRPATYVSGWKHTDHVHEVGESLIERDDGSQAIVANASIRCKDRPR